MEEQNRVTAIKAYKRGLWRIRIWPMILLILFAIGIGYLIFLELLTWVIGLGIVLGFILIGSIWSLRKIATWKMWMVKNTINPKTAIELARSTFLKASWKESLTIWGGRAKTEYRELYDAQMAQLKQAYLKDAKDRYSHKRPISIHYRFASLMWMFLFEVIVLSGLIYLFIIQEDLMVKIVLGLLFIIGFGALIYTLKTIWRRNRTVIEISIHGITIEGKHFGWIELDEVDVVRGDTLVYQKHKGPKQEMTLKNLSLSGDYLDELILFYRNTDAKESAQ